MQQLQIKSWYVVQRDYRLFIEDGMFGIILSFLTLFRRLYLHCVTSVSLSTWKMTVFYDRYFFHKTDLFFFFFHKRKSRIYVSLIWPFVSIIFLKSLVLAAVKWNNRVLASVFNVLFYVHFFNDMKTKGFFKETSFLEPFF